MKRLKVKTAEAGVRADVFVTSKFPDFTRSSLEGLFDNGLIKIGQKPVKPSYKIKQNEVLLVDDKPLTTLIDTLEIPIIYEDDNVLVVNKPEKVLTHSKGAITDEASVATFIKPKISNEFLNNNRAGIVHRLDRATSGVLVTAKSKAALSSLQKQFSLRKAKKRYIAIVNGVPEEPEAIIDVAIERNPNRPQTFRAGSNGKKAVTQYKVVETFTKGDSDFALVELIPTTGRTHQIRLHMAYIGNPVVGDVLYAKQDLPHMYLHSAQLEITIPGSERKIFEAPLPKYFKEFINK